MERVVIVGVRGCEGGMGGWVAEEAVVVEAWDGAGGWGHRDGVSTVPLSLKTTVVLVQFVS